MADDNKKLEARIAALEKSAADATARAERAELKSKRDLAALREAQLAYKRDVSAIQSMRDLTGADSAYVEDPAEKYEQLMKDTLLTKDGRRHYFNPDAAAYVGNMGKPPFEYYPRESIISVAKDQLPSLTWLPTESAGKDPKTGKLLIVPKGVMSKEPEPEDGSNEPITNTSLNDKAAKQRAELAARGGGPAPVEGSRASDQTVG